jgi:hypothetical protein
LPEPSCRLELAEHRLDDFLAQAVAATPAAAFEPAPHRLGQRAERLAFGVARMLGPGDGDVARDVRAARAAKFASEQ